MSSCIHRILIIGRTLVVTAFVSSTLSFAIPTAQAAELQVEVTISIREPVAEIATAFEKRTGHKVKMTVAAPGEILAALQAGRHADVVVVTDGALAEIENKGLVRREGVPLASEGFGLATRSGDHVPDISTPEALRAVLLVASKVIYNDPNVTESGQLLLRIAERLGVADQAQVSGRGPGGQRKHAGQRHKPRNCYRPERLDPDCGPSGREVGGAAAEGVAGPGDRFCCAGRTSPGRGRGTGVPAGTRQHRGQESLRRDWV
jgi:ABC-type molybdate transport system substrate-binding protein